MIAPVSHPVVPVLLPRRFLRSLGQNLVLRGLMVMVVVEAIYLSDKVLNELLSSMLEFGVGAGFLLQTVLLAIPEIVAAGLPPALFVAVYLTLHEQREAGGFLALLAAGCSPWAAICWLGGIGAVAAVLALTVAGWVQPLAATSLQHRIDAARAAAAVHRFATVDRFISMSGMTFYIHPKTDADQAAVFVVIDQPDGAFDVVTAIAGAVVPQGPFGSLDVTLTEAEVLGLRPSDAETGTGLSQTHRLAVDRLVLGQGQVPAAGVAWTPLQHMTLSDLLKAAKPDVARTAEVVQRVASSLLAALAPLCTGVGARFSAFAGGAGDAGGAADGRLCGTGCGATAGGGGSCAGSCGANCGCGGRGCAAGCRDAALLVRLGAACAAGWLIHDCAGPSARPFWRRNTLCAVALPEADHSGGGRDPCGCHRH